MMIMKNMPETKRGFDRSSLLSASAPSTTTGDQLKRALPTDRSVRNSAAASMERSGSETDADSVAHDIKKLRPSDDEEQQPILSENDAKYRADRLRAMLQRVFGLIGKNLARELTDGNIGQAFMNEIIAADIAIFQESDHLSGLFEGVLMHIVCSIRTVDDFSEAGDILGERLPGMDILNTREQRVFVYLKETFNRLFVEDDNQFLADYERDGLTLYRGRILDIMLLFLQGFLTGGDRSVVTAVFTRALLADTVPSSLFRSLIKRAVDTNHTDRETLNKVFMGVLGDLLAFVSRHCLSDGNEHFVFPLRVLLDLVSVKLEDNSRPFCQMLICRSDWLPDTVTNAAGREFSRLCYLGPFFELSMLPEDGDLIAAGRFFDVVEIPQESRQFVFSRFQNKLQTVRRHLHQILHQMLANSGSREAVLTWLGRMIKLNEKKAQIQADNTKLASDGFLLNLLNVLYELSAKINLDKVHPYYLFHPASRVDAKQQTRLKLSLEDAEQHAKTLDMEYEIKFPTECFFLTMAAQQAALQSSFMAYTHMKRSLAELEHQYQQLEKAVEGMDASTQAVEKRDGAKKLARLLDVRTKLKKSLYCREATLTDEGFLARALAFCSKQLAFLLRAINPDYAQTNQLPDNAPMLFGIYPEYYLENSLDLIVFLMKTAPKVLLESRIDDLPQQLLAFICSTHYFNNPFLAAKVVEVMFMLCPDYMPQAQAFFNNLINSPLAIERLFPSLVKFYSDVETTGSHTEFFDKFNIRREIQVIFRSLWYTVLYRSNMVKLARQCPPDFIRFINMVINDATFLLDESLTALKTIHEVETLMDNTVEWNGMTPEEREMKVGVVDQAKRSVIGYLALGKDTMDLFCYLTKDAPEPFYDPVLGQRLAEMLDYNVTQLCGPKCTELKVKDAVNRFKWDPRKLMGQIVEVYLNLTSEKFADFMAHDERSYTPDQFAMVLARLERSMIVPHSQVERMRNLAEMARECYVKKANEEEDFDEEMPDEFKDQMMYSLMKDPVRLPSGIVMDRTNILRHLLSTRNDPFTNLPMSEADLVPDVELKIRIKQWLEKKRADRQQSESR